MNLKWGRKSLTWPRIFLLISKKDSAIIVGTVVYSTIFIHGGVFMRDPRKVKYNIVVSLVCFALIALIIIFAKFKAGAAEYADNTNNIESEYVEH